MVRAASEAPAPPLIYGTDMPAFRSGRSLTDAEVDAYHDVVETSLARRVRVYQIPLIPGGYAGITFGRRVLLARSVRPEGDSSLLAHELVHVQQFANQGTIRFLARYLGSFAWLLIRHRDWGTAYQRIPAEIDARQRTTKWARGRVAGQRS